MCQVPFPCQSLCLRGVSRGEWGNHRTHARDDGHLLEGRVVCRDPKILFWRHEERREEPWHVQRSRLAGVFNCHPVSAQMHDYTLVCCKGSPRKTGVGQGKGTRLETSNTSVKKETEVGWGAIQAEAARAKTLKQEPVLDAKQWEGASYTVHVFPSTFVMFTGT